MPSVWRLLSSLLGVAVILVLLIGGWLYFTQRQLIFPAPAGSIPDDLGAGVVSLPLSEGHALLALPASPRGPAPLIVFTHGNAELAHWSLDSFRYFRDRGVAVLLVEYPGYGGTAGSPGADAIERSLLMAVDRVLAREDIDPDRLIAYGRSIGTGAASRLAARRKIASLVLESPFTTLQRLVSEHGYPAFLLRDRFDNASVVASLDVPVFLYHGIRDSIIPHSHSEHLLSLNHQASLLSADCGHNDCPRPWTELMAFLVANGILPGN